MSSSKPHISFIGLGAMGFGMASHLVKEGYAVTGFDVNQMTMEKFKQAGGLTATTPSAVAANKDYCVCMVATAQQAQSVLMDGEDPVFNALPQNAVLLLCSTVPSSYVQSLEQQLTDRGRADIFLVDCPVSGGTARAADGTLSIMAGGSGVAIEKGLFLLQAMSDPEKLYVVKGGIGAGSNMKMCHQVLASNQILAASEAMGFAQHLGLDLKAAAEVVKSGDGWSWMFENRFPRMLDPDFKPVASAITIILKDTSIITSEARRIGFASLMTSVAEQVYFTALGRGYGPDDDASVLRVYNEGKGKIGPVRGKAEAEAEKMRLVVNLLEGIHLCSAAENLAMARHLGLDVDQVFNLCTNAAGGSRLLSKVGPEIMRAFRDTKAAQGWKTEDANDLLQTAAKELQKAVEEAQLLKVPIFLGSQALNLMRTALQSGGEMAPEMAKGSIVKLWVQREL